MERMNERGREIEKTGGVGKLRHSGSEVGYARFSTDEDESQLSAK